MTRQYLALHDTDFVDKFDVNKLNDTVLYTRMDTVIKTAGSELGDREVLFKITDKTLDRDNDTINPKGWDLKNFKKNPVVLWAHNKLLPPIGYARNTKKDGDYVSSVTGFLSEDYEEFEHGQFAKMIYMMYKDGILNTVSVGFKATDAKWRNDDEELGYGYDFLKQELLEYSPVPVPSNPNAVALARSRGINLDPAIKWTEQQIDEHNMIVVPKKELEEFYMTVKGKTTQVKTDVGSEQPADTTQTEPTDQTNLQVQVTTDSNDPNLVALVQSMITSNQEVTQALNQTAQQLTQAMESLQSNNESPTSDPDDDMDGYIQMMSEDGSPVLDNEGNEIWLAEPTSDVSE